MPIVKKTVIFFILQVFSLLLCVFLFKKYNMKLKFNSGYWKIAGLRPSASGLLFSGELLETGGIHNVAYGKIAGLTACYFQWNSWILGKSIILVIARVKITCSVWEFFINLTSKLQEMYEKIRKNILLIL